MNQTSTPSAPVETGGSLTASKAREVAKNAFIYGFPLVDHYRIQHAYFEDRGNPDFRAPWNEIANTARVFTPDDIAMQTANSDTPYSFIGFDLRVEPMVVTVPSIEEGRYFSIQLIDAYTHNFDYVGTRTTGNGGGVFLIAGPKWQGEVPDGINKVIRPETEFAYAMFRTQLFNADDIENVKRIQAGYKVEPASSFTGTPAPSPEPLTLIKPISPEEQKSSIEFFNILNFVLRFCPTHSSETALRQSFQQVGFNGQDGFDVHALPAEIKDALKQGMTDGWAEFAVFKRDIVDTGKRGSADVFGTREHLANNYMFRLAGAALGIYGNSQEEAIYPYLSTDADGQLLNGANNYVIRFSPGQLPPVGAFWSLTMYKLPESLLIHNPLNRYLLNSTMMDQFVSDEDGGLTLHLRTSSPGSDKEANWLPAPPGPFLVLMRLYIPKQEVLEGRWKAPRPVKAD